MTVKMPAAETPGQLSEFYRAIMEADDRGDAITLAWLGWALFTMASTAEEAHREALGLLGELRTAARAATAGHGSPASMAPLRHVLARHGWLPPHDATPLQALAAPTCAYCSSLDDRQEPVALSRAESGRLGNLRVTRQLPAQLRRVSRSHSRGRQVAKGGMRGAQQGQRPHLVEHRPHVEENL